MKNTITGKTLAPVLALACFTLASAADAQQRGSLIDLINEYRTDPGECEGRRARPERPFDTNPAFAKVLDVSNAELTQELARVGYRVTRAETISISGAMDARAVMKAIERPYCRTLLSKEYSAMGVSRTGDDWRIILAQPAPVSIAKRLPPMRDAGQAILQAVNQARSSARKCGSRSFGAARPLSWNGALAKASLAHSTDMVKHNFFSHESKDGRDVGARAVQAGYRWFGIGENIAMGQESAAEVVENWLDSPGHCANIMQPTFTQMGAAFVVDEKHEPARAYWTQVFGLPR